MTRHKAILLGTTIASLTLAATAGPIGAGALLQSPIQETLQELSPRPYLRSLPAQERRDPLLGLRLPAGFVPAGKEREYRRLMKILPQILHRTGLGSVLKKKRIHSVILALSVIRAESTFSQDARSSANARGFWQLMEATAREVQKRHPKHFKPDMEIDDHTITHPQVNSTLGALYLKNLIHHPKNKSKGLAWAVMAYNTGATNTELGCIPDATKGYLEEIFTSYNDIVRLNPNLGFSTMRKKRRFPDASPLCQKPKKERAVLLLNRLLHNDG